MKLLLFIFLVSFSPENCQSINEIRINFQQFEKESELESYLQLFEKATCNQAIPYQASAMMQQAEFTMNPIKKLDYFMDGKEVLESFISKYPKSIEARYVRVQVQFHTPDFLNYQEQLESDIEFILKNIAKSGLASSYRKQIITNIQYISKRI